MDSKSLISFLHMGFQVFLSLSLSIDTASLLCAQEHASGYSIAIKSPDLSQHMWVQNSFSRFNLSQLQFFHLQMRIIIVPTL